MKRISIDIL